MSTTYFADEQIDLSGTTVQQLDASLFSPAGTSKATKAYISHIDGDDPVLYRFNDDPNKTTRKGHPITVGGGVVIEGFDNLVSVRFLLDGTDPARLQVSYAS